MEEYDRRLTSRPNSDLFEEIIKAIKIPDLTFKTSELRS
jgi:hypothetical protein